ncbi:MAG: helix-hairpin-helix domain-containing protein [Thermoplasmatota archaeon]
MPENETGSETSRNAQSKSIERNEMVSFLTSTGKIKEGLAGSLYDSGLDDWNKLVEGDEKYFTSFKGVGKKTAEYLVALAEIKGKELESASGVPDLKEVLASVPRISTKIIDSLYDSGYDAYSKFADIEAKDLQKLKGIGPKLSESIMEAVRSALEKYDIPFESIEEATAEMMKEEAAAEQEEETTERSGSLMDRIVNAIKGFFSGKKDQAPEEKEPEPPSEKEEKEPADTDAEPEETEEEAPPEADETPEEPLEEQKGEGLAEEPDETLEEEPEAPDETPEEIPDEESKPEEVKAEEEPVTEEKVTGEPEEAVKEEVGFFQRIKEMFFGKKVEPAAEEQPSLEEEPEGLKEGPEEEMVLDEDEADEEASKEPEEHIEETEPASGDEAPEMKGEIKEFEDIPGVSKKTAELLRNSGYLSLEELREAVPEDLVMIDGIGLKTAKKICDALKE